MRTNSADMIESLQAIDAFVGTGLSVRIASLERTVKGCDRVRCRTRGIGAGVTSDLLAAAHSVKVSARQIDALIHAVGVLLLLPQIMDSGERIESVSLGAGNTGRKFDLETSEWRRRMM